MPLYPILVETVSNGSYWIDVSGTRDDAKSMAESIAVSGFYKDYSGNSEPMLVHIPPVQVRASSIYLKNEP